MRFPPKCPNDVVDKLPNPDGPPIHKPKPGDPDCGKDCFKNCYDNRSKIPALRPLLNLIRFHCNLHCNAVLMGCANAGGPGGTNPTLPPPGGGGPKPPTTNPPSCNDTPDPNCAQPKTLSTSPARLLCLPPGAIIDTIIGSPKIDFCEDSPTPNTNPPCQSTGSICAPSDNPDIVPGRPRPTPPKPVNPTPSQQDCDDVPGFSSKCSPCTPPALPKDYGTWTIEEGNIWVRYHPDGRPILEPTPDGGFAIEYPQFGRLLFDENFCPVDSGRPTIPPRPIPTPVCKRLLSDDQGHLENCVPVFCDDVPDLSSICAPLPTKPDKDPQRPVFIPIDIMPPSATTIIAQMSGPKNLIKSGRYSVIINHPSIDSFKTNSASNFTISSIPNSNALSDIVAKCESSGSFEFFSTNFVQYYNIVSMQDISVI